MGPSILSVAKEWYHEGGRFVRGDESALPTIIRMGSASARAAAESAAEAKRSANSVGAAGVACGDAAVPGGASGGSAPTGRARGADGAAVADGGSMGGSVSSGSKVLPPPRSALFSRQCPPCPHPRSACVLHAHRVAVAATAAPRTEAAEGATRTQTPAVRRIIPRCHAPLSKARPPVTSLLSPLSCHLAQVRAAAAAMAVVATAGR